MGSSNSPHVVFLSFPLAVSFLQVFSESDNSEVISSHLSYAPVWHTQPSGPGMEDFVMSMLCSILGRGLVLTYGMKSLCHSAKQCYHWVWAHMEFFQ